jgi:hypothetical protein
MRLSETDPDAYIASLPDGVREDVAELDAEISAIMAGQARVLWEGVFWGGSEQHIIGYGAQTYVDRSGKEIDWFVIGLARQKSYLSLYVSVAEDGTYLVKRYSDRLGKVKVGSAVVSFKQLADVDRSVLAEMLSRARDLSAGT